MTSRMEFWIELLASGLSIVVGIVVGFLTHELVAGAGSAVLFLGIVVFGIVSFASYGPAETTIEKPSQGEKQVRTEGPEQPSNLRGDAAEPTERQTAEEGVAVRRAPKKPDRTLIEHGRATKPLCEEPEEWFDKGTALLNLRKREEALQCIDEAIRLKPDNPEA
jgi:hypothetical protein